MKRNHLLLLLLIFLLDGLSAQTSRAGFVAPAPAALNDFADIVMSSTADRTELESAFRAAEPAVATLPDELSRLVHEAQRNYLRAFAELGYVRAGTGNETVAVEMINRTIELAERANAIVETSEGFRLLADARNQLLKLRGTVYRMTHYRRARESVERAVDLNPANPFAQLSAAGYYTSAHPIAGGDTRRGLEHAEAAARRIEFLSDEDARYVRFLTGIWVARGLAGEGQRDAAESALRRSLQIYPDNWWLAEVADELGIALTPAPDAR